MKAEFFLIKVISSTKDGWGKISLLLFSIYEIPLGGYQKAISLLYTEFLGAITTPKLNSNKYEFEFNFLLEYY